MLYSKKILIFGGTGSLGNALTERYLSNNTIYVFSRDEAKHWNMKINYNSAPNLNFIIGDIFNENKVENTLLRVRPDIVIIASAMKHVDQCEINAQQCINTNLIGTKNILDGIEMHRERLSIQAVIFISTDKACSPINTYGMAKALSEQLMIEKAYYMKGSTRFINVRYGNVLNSNGSIIPFLHKIGRDSDTNAFPLTDKNMTRFVMTLVQSVDLIEYAITHGESGETIIPELVSMRTSDLIELFSEKYKKPIRIIGLRPGEKILESLINSTQSARLETKNSYFHIKSIFEHRGTIDSSILNDYNSTINPLSKQKLKEYLLSHNLL